MSRKEKLIKEAIEKLQAAQQLETESAHLAADDTLCELLEALGYKAVVEEYYNVSKWYA